MKICEIIREAIVYQDVQPSGVRFVIVSNPSPKQFQTMLTNSREHILRGLGFSTGLYVWDAYYADHHMAMSRTHAHSDFLFEFEPELIILEHHNGGLTIGQNETVDQLQSELVSWASSILTAVAPFLAKAYSPMTQIICEAQYEIENEDGDYDSDMAEVKLGSVRDYMR